MTSQTQDPSQHDPTTMILIVSSVPVIFVLVFILDKLYRSYTVSNLPPGPLYIPLIGNLPFLDQRRPWKTLKNWGNKYGPIYRLYFGRRLIVVLNDYETIKEAFENQAEVFAGRPHIWIFESFQGGQMGIIQADGDRWKEQRRFSLQLLKDFGFGRSTLEDKMNAEIDVLIDEIDKQLIDGKAEVDIKTEMNYAITNIIFSIVVGWTYERGDPEFLEFTAAVDDILQLVGLVAGFLEYFPFLRYIIPGGLGYDKLVKYDKLLRDGFYRREVKKARLRCEDGITSDFLAVYWRQILKCKKEDEANGVIEDDVTNFFNANQLENIVGDLFFAGQDTTLSTMQWGLLFLMYNPDIQDKLVAEMTQEVGQCPALADKSKLPYTQATIMEIQRLGNIVPFSVLHSTREATILKGYFIPQDTTILPHLWAVHMDEQRFPQPEQFNPDRFLHPDGTLNTKVESFMPFSTGKRQCMGENLAKMELFIFLTKLVWNYEFSFGEEYPKPSLEPILKFTSSPEFYKPLITKRLH